MMTIPEQPVITKSEVIDGLHWSDIALVAAYAGGDPFDAAGMNVLARANIEYKDGAGDLRHRGGAVATNTKEQDAILRAGIILGWSLCRDAATGTDR